MNTMDVMKQFDKDLYIRQATALQSAGIIFRAAQGKETDACSQLFRDYVSPDAGVGDNDVCIAAFSESTPVGAVRSITYNFPSGAAVTTIRSLAVTPEWRNQGIGTILARFTLSIPCRASMVYGNCRQKERSFYESAGFHVLNPGEPLYQPEMDVELRCSDPVYDCWFYLLQ